MGSRERNKGRRAEQEIASYYRQRGYKAARVPNSGGLDTKGDVTGVPPTHIEVKHQEKLNVWKALKQCEVESPPAAIPALHFRRNRTGWYVAISLDDFADLLEEARR